MNKEQALKIVSDVCANFKGNLADHQAIQSALKFIVDALNEKVEAEKLEVSSKE